ncbi:hypothetical protein AB0F15_05295 [Amycolatopsis sp. NPDC026612]|uniref:hypothetical protein n=1 Tax=Amycolatopsis sp. NPDC026612 TaxID=3155466 RepID=UPI003407541D
MRLVRLERQQSRVADDIRAALASLGRGSTVIGGIALVGVGSVTERPIEAVVVLPHGVIIVIGVDLPDPALRLEAPLGGPWKADGWPLVADDDAINPATEALDLSQACERRIADLVPGTAPVGTIIAVGPYVETVDQPAGDLAGPVRVLHPTPTTMLAATVSLATAHRPRSVDQARALIRGLAPSAPEFSDEVLLGEGFSRLTDDAPPESLWDAGPAVPAQPPGGEASAAGSSTVERGPAAADSAAADPAGAISAGPAPAGPAPAAPGAAGSASASNTAAPADPPEPGPTAPRPDASTPATPTTASASPPAPAAAGSADAVPATPAPATTAPADPPEPGPAKPRPAAAALPAVGASDWRTKAPVQAEPPPAGDSASVAETQPTQTQPQPTSDSPPAAETQPASAEPQPTSDSPPAPETQPAQAEPQLSATADLTPPPADAEAAAEAGRTEVLPSPAEEEPDRPAGLPARPVFPGTGAAEPSPFPGAIPPDGPEPAGAESERTENLRLPSPSSERIEGFAAAGRTTPHPTAPPAAETAAADPPSFPAPRPQPGPSASRTVRWLPLAAIGALVLLVVAAIAVATTGDGTAAAPVAPAGPATQASPSRSAAPVRNLQFALRAAGGDQRCASHAFGDAQASLQRTSCSGVRRASYAATVDGRGGAVTVGIVEFPDAAQAAAFKAVADTPGGGGVLDLATETGQWGATPAPQFENAAYASKLDGSSVRLVQAVWAPGPSSPDDPGLLRAAKAALDLPAR